MFKTLYKCVSVQGKEHRLFGKYYTFPLLGFCASSCSQGKVERITPSRLVSKLELNTRVVRNYESS